MTECNTKPLAFSSLCRKQIVADFDGGWITSDGGGLLLREVDRKIGLIEALAGCITDRRDPRSITHSVASMLRQRVVGIALGYEDLADHQTLRDDPLMKLLAGRDPSTAAPLASPPTLSRLENGVDRAALARLAEVFVETFIASHTRRRPNWSSISTPPTTRSTAPRKAASSTATTTPTATCRCTSSAATSCW